MLLDLQFAGLFALKNVSLRKLSHPWWDAGCFVFVSVKVLFF